MNPYMATYNEVEDGVITTFVAHPFFKSISSLTDAQFGNYLLQLAQFSSLQFEKWLLWGSLGVQDAQARRLMWATLSEEIPAKGQPHKYLLLRDLGLIGVTPEIFLNVKPSPATRKAVRQMYALFRFPQEQYDLKSVISWRVLTEVLVAEQYRFVVAELERRFGILPEQTVFYGDHRDHDRKGSKGSHTGYSDRWLNGHIVDHKTLTVAVTAAKRAMRVRYNFHTQEF